MSDETVMKHAEAMADALGDESWRLWTQEQAGEVEEVLDSLRRMVRDRDDGCCISCPPASSPAHDPVTCTCCQIALGATKARDAREAGHGEAFGIVLDRLTDAERSVVKARAEREDARRFARSLVEKARRIQGHIEAGGANEELTAATVLCSEILADAEWGMNERDRAEKAEAAGVPVWVKQVGARPVVTKPVWVDGWATGESRLARLPLRHRDGADPSEWPADLRIQEMHSTKRYHTAAGSTLMLDGAHGGIADLVFDWAEEPGACCDCTPEPYPVDGRLVWTCETCGGGSAEWFEDEAATPGGE